MFVARNSHGIRRLDNLARVDLDQTGTRASTEPAYGTLLWCSMRSRSFCPEQNNHASDRGSEARGRLSLDTATT